MREAYKYAGLHFEVTSIPRQTEGIILLCNAGTSVSRKLCTRTINGYSLAGKVQRLYDYIFIIEC